MDRSRLAVALLALSTATASAHTEKQPKRDRLELSAARARVVLDYLIPGGPEARALRGIFDRDRSGALDGRERAELVEYLARQAAHFTALAVDGQPIVLARAGVDPAFGDGPDAPLAVTVTLSAPLALARGPHRVRFEDRHKDRRLDVPVAVALDGLVPTVPLPLAPLVFADHPLALEVEVVARE